MLWKSIFEPCSNTQCISSTSNRAGQLISYEQSHSAQLNVFFLRWLPSLPPFPFNLDSDGKRKGKKVPNLYCWNISTWFQGNVEQDEVWCFYKIAVSQVQYKCSYQNCCACSPSTTRVWFHCPCWAAHQKREQKKKPCTLFDFPLKQHCGKHMHPATVWHHFQVFSTWMQCMCSSVEIHCTRQEGCSHQQSSHRKLVIDVMVTFKELGIWLRCMPAFAARLLRVKQDSGAQTLLCAAGSMDVKHPGYINCDV